LNPQNWPVSFFKKISKRLDEGTLLMAKIKTKNDRQLIFDAEVIWTKDKSIFGGYPTGFGVVRASLENINELKKLVKK
jgi:hypothetical protein